MRICRFSHGEEVSFGVLDNLDDQGELADNSIIAILSGHPFGELEPDGRVIAASAVKLLATQSQHGVFLTEPIHCSQQFDLRLIDFTTLGVNGHLHRQFNPIREKLVQRWVN